MTSMQRRGWTGDLATRFGRMDRLFDEWFRSIPMRRPFADWPADDMIRVDEYRDGERHGPSVSWNDRGEKVKEEHWADGRPHGTWTVWEHGAVSWTHTFDHGDP